MRVQSKTIQIIYCFKARKDLMFQASSNLISVRVLSGIVLALVILRGLLLVGSTDEGLG